MNKGGHQRKGVSYLDVEVEEKRKLESYFLRGKILML